MKPMVPTGTVPRIDAPTTDELRMSSQHDRLPATLEKLKQLHHYSKMLLEIARSDTPASPKPGWKQPDWQVCIDKAVGNCTEAARALAQAELPAQVYFSPASALDSAAAWRELENFLEAHAPYYKLGIRKSSSGFTVTGERK